MRRAVPSKPSIDGLESRWSSRWESDGTYSFDRSAPRERVYSIDTPPPTVSGSLHIGHVFSYTHTDVVARFWRMRGKQVFYPIGWDDNGVPTERRVENHFNVRCDPAMTDDDPAAAALDAEGKGRPVRISRPAFIRLCEELTSEDEKTFEELWRRVGLSVDWSRTYTTVGERARRSSQRGFLRLLQRGEAYSTEAPTLWDVDFQTAVSQAELEDREIEGAWHRLAFRGESGNIEVDTTRPELLPACVALVAHPDDERYSKLIGRSARTPLFGVEVPVLAHHLADPDKGTGIAMVCTFGDVADVAWWRELSLPLRAVVGRDGRLAEVSFGSQGWESDEPSKAQAAYDRLAGKTVASARSEIVSALTEEGSLLGSPRPLRHVVKHYEKGRRPLEIVTSRQWFIRLLDHKEELIRRGRELDWHPGFMRQRYESWVEGLSSDWNLSRQRYFGVPFPVWYPLDEKGEADHSRPLLPEESRLPVDPSTDVPDGYAAEQRGAPGGFVADPDIMDTWATSSLTPQIAAGWEEDPDLFERVFPMDLRPQGQDIIRTWLFYTVSRAHLEHDSLPWRHATISGFIVDPDRKKMSKSKGNVVVPMDLLEEHGTDGVRYWAASARLGTDAVADPSQMRVGRRLAIKILNVSRFVLGLRREEGDPASEISDASPPTLSPVDACLLRRLAAVVADATAALESYDHARALERTEEFFWSFCDDYVELVKARAYGTAEGETAPANDPAGSGRESALVTLETALSVMLRLFAPFLPFISEEAWSWWKESSVHVSPWPSFEELATLAGQAPEEDVFDVAAEVLGAVRKAKTSAHLSMRAPVRLLRVGGSSKRLAALDMTRDDVMSAGVVSHLDSIEGDTSVEVHLEETG